MTSLHFSSPSCSELFTLAPWTWLPALNWSMTANTLAGGRGSPRLKTLPSAGIWSLLPSWVVLERGGQFQLWPHSVPQEQKPCSEQGQEGRGPSKVPGANPAMQLRLLQRSRGPAHYKPSRSPSWVDLAFGKCQFGGELSKISHGVSS